MKKIIILFIAIVLLAGCSTAGTKDAQPAAAVSSASGTPAPAKATGGKPVTLRFSWWGSDDRNQATLKAMKLYHDLNPNVTVEGEPGNFDTYYQKLLTQLASKTAPDIIQIDHKWIGDLIRQGKPMTNINDLKNTIKLNDFPMDSMKEFSGQGDYLMGLPVGINGRGVLYNTEFFKKFGIQASDDWDWNKILEVGAKVNQQDKNSHLLFFEKNGIVQVMLDWMKQKYGVNMFADDYTPVFNEQDLVDVFTYIKQMVDTGTVPPMDEMVLYESVYPDQVPNWLNGKWGMTSLSASNLLPILAASKFEVGTMKQWVKQGAKNSGITVAPTQLLAVNDNSPNKEEAAKFINWYLNDDQAILITKDTRGVPANNRAKKLLEDQGMIKKQVGSMLTQALSQAGSAEGGLTHNTELSDLTKQYFYKVGYKKITPEAAAQQAMADYKKVLAELKKAGK